MAYLERLLEVIGRQLGGGHQCGECVLDQGLPLHVQFKALGIGVYQTTLGEQTV